MFYLSHDPPKPLYMNPFLRTRSSFYLFASLLFLLQFSGREVVAQAVTSGISVQGIARDADKSALGDELMTFTFEILDAAGGTSYYKEDVSIRTDPYGVFSHIIGTGNVLAGSGNFIEIPFSQKLMKLVINVTYRGNQINLSNAPFQYSPYAKSAENGVPTGTIVPYAGAAANIPAGWTLCDGKDLNGVPGSLNLRTLLGTNIAPNLQGMFLRGTGTSPVNGQAGPGLRQTQADGIKTHNSSGTTSTDGNHTHTWLNGLEGDDEGSGSSNNEYTQIGGSVTTVIQAAGDHSHTVTTTYSGLSETRPVNYGVNYIIKL